MTGILSRIPKKGLLSTEDQQKVYNLLKTYRMSTICRRLTKGQLPTEDLQKFQYIDKTYKWSTVYRRPNIRREFIFFQRDYFTQLQTNYITQIAVFFI